MGESNGGRSRTFGNAGTLSLRDRSIERVKFSPDGTEAKMSKIDSQRRRDFLKGSVAAAFAANSWGWPAGAAPAEDAPRAHGMLIVGEQTVFLSHLALFGPPHHYQVIMEASFAKPGGDPQADYFNDRKRTGTKFYTLEPAEAFVLPRLAAAEPLRSFKATIYRKHFERFDNRRQMDAARIGEDVEVTITRVIHFRKFDLAAPKLAQLEYLLFGKGGELLLAHMLTRPPDFDQVLSVKVLNQKFTDEELSQGVPIVIQGRPNSISGRISGTKPVTGQIKGTGGAPPKMIQLQPGIEFFFETGDFKA
jgi:hypothetical protein